ncbi:MAG: hypothetical protein ACYS8W_07595 [Planctomycetota bacterium]|jgi:hypothetical protein
MKLSLPLKLGIGVIILFALTIAACLLYKPLRLRWYESKLDSEDLKIRKFAVEKLLTLGDGGKAVLDERIIGKDRKWVLTQFGESNDVEGSAIPSWSCYDFFAVIFNTDNRVKHIVQFDYFAQFQELSESDRDLLLEHEVYWQKRKYQRP